VAVVAVVAVVAAGGWQGEEPLLDPLDDPQPARISQRGAGDQGGRALCSSVGGPFSTRFA